MPLGTAGSALSHKSQLSSDEEEEDSGGVVPPKVVESLSPGGVLVGQKTTGKFGMGTRKPNGSIRVRAQA